MTGNDYTRRQWVTEVCPTGKRAYFTRRAAKTAARSVAKLGSPGNRPYVCPRCDYWHIGHKPTAAVLGQAAASDVYRGRQP